MRAKALAMLSGLEKRDLMPDAMAYVALATLHHRLGDRKASKAALQRCRKMTKHRGICRVYRR